MSSKTARRSAASWPTSVLGHPIRKESTKPKKRLAQTRTFHFLLLGVLRLRLFLPFQLTHRQDSSFSPSTLKINDISSQQSRWVREGSFSRLAFVCKWTIVFERSSANMRRCQLFSVGTIHHGGPTENLD